MFDVVKIKDVKQEIGLLIKSLRKQRGISQQELADTLDVSRTTIQNLELGKNFTINTVLKIFQEFGLLEKLMEQILGERSQIGNKVEEDTQDYESKGKKNSLY